MITGRANWRRQSALKFLEASAYLKPFTCVGIWPTFGAPFGNSWSTTFISISDCWIVVCGSWDFLRFKSPDGQRASKPCFICRFIWQRVYVPSWPLPIARVLLSWQALSSPVESELPCAPLRPCLLLPCRPFCPSHSLLW